MWRRWRYSRTRLLQSVSDKLEGLPVMYGISVSLMKQRTSRTSNPAKAAVARNSFESLSCWSSWKTILVATARASANAIPVPFSSPA